MLVLAVAAVAVGAAHLLVAVLPVRVLLVAVLPAVLLPVGALVVLLPQFLARSLRQAQLLRPVLLPVVGAVLRPVEVAAVVVSVHGQVRSEILRRR